MPTIIRSGAATAARARRVWIGAGMLAGCGLCTPAPAAQWKVQPYVDVGAVRDDNIRLTTAPHETTSAHVAAVRMDAEGATETSKTRLNGFIAHTRYDGDLEDKTEHRLRLDAEKQTSERGTLRLDGEYRRTALFETVVIPEEGVGDVRDVDVGVTTETQVRRNYRVLQPAWRWLLTERSSMELAYRLTDVSFSDRAPTSRLDDYEENLFRASYERQLTPRDNMILTANVSRYRPDDTDAEAETLQLLVGRGRAFSETLRGSVSVGASRTDERVGAAEEESTGAVINARLRQEAELSRLEGVISRDVTPSGIGRALRTDQVRLHWVRQVAPTVEFVLDAKLLRVRVVEGSDPDVNRRYYQVTPELRWRWLENLSVVGSYRYRRQKYEADPDSADSSAVFLGLSYRL